MKKTLQYSLLLLIAVVLTFMIFQIVKKLKERQEKESLRQTLPDIKFYTLDQVPFTNSDIPAEYSVVIVYFNPECDQCENEALEIGKNIHSFTRTMVLMITNKSAEEARQFAVRFALANQPNVRFLIDPEKQYNKVFDANTVPNIFIYNRLQQLVKHYEGQTKIEAILQHLD